MMSRSILVPLRFAAPQVLTSIRILVAALAVVFASRQQIHAAATLLLLGFATDALDGACARLLGVATEFGKLFDLFADYLYFVIAPAVLSLMIAEPAGAMTVLVLAIPCVFGALRYARKAGLSETEYPGIPASPGVPTIAYALFVIGVSLLRDQQALSRETTAVFLVVGAPVLAILMTVRTRYPKLSVFPWMLVPILVGLTIMPFVQTAALATVMLILIGAYVIFGPVLVVQRPGDVWKAAEGRPGA